MTKSEARRLSGTRYKMQIKKEELAQCVAACLLDPYEVRLGKERLFEDELYQTIFDGRSASDYLVFIRLHNFVRYCCRGDTRKGRAKWLVLNFMWSQLGALVQKRSGLRDQFLHVASREYRYESACKGLYTAINQAFGAAMMLYRENRKTDTGILDESSFFKHRNRHKQLSALLSVRGKTSRARAISEKVAKFANFLEQVGSEL